MTSCPHKAAFDSGNVLATCQWQPTWPHTMCVPWVRICRMHTKVNRSSSSIETNLCNNVQRNSCSSLFQSFHSFFFFFWILFITYLFSLLGVQGVLLSRVNCWDWPGVCTAENVTQFPTIKIYKKGEQPLMYNGMWGTEELTSFIML